MDKVEVIKDGYAYRIRKITPKESFLLMGLTNQEFEDAEKVASNSALYKAAGNGLVPNCIVAILGQMIPGREDYYKRELVDKPVETVDNE